MLTASQRSSKPNSHEDEWLSAMLEDFHRRRDAMKAAEVRCIKEEWAAEREKENKTNPLLGIIRDLRYNIQVYREAFPMKKLPIKGKATETKKVETKAKKSTKAEVKEEPKKTGPAPTLEELKAMSNPDKVKLCKKLGIPYQTSSNEKVAHMFLLGALKRYYGIVKEKPNKEERKAARKDKGTFIVESNAALETIMKQNEKIIELLEKIVLSS